MISQDNVLRKEAMNALLNCELNNGIESQMIPEFSPYIETCSVCGTQNEFLLVPGIIPETFNLVSSFILTITL